MCILFIYPDHSLQRLGSSSYIVVAMVCVILFSCINEVMMCHFSFSPYSLLSHTRTTHRHSFCPQVHAGSALSVQQPVGCPPSQCSAFLHVISCLFRAQVSLQWATGWPSHSRVPHKEALYDSDSQAPWEEAQPHFEWDTHSVPRQQGAHLLHGKLGFHHRCAWLISVTEAVRGVGRWSSFHFFTTSITGYVCFMWFQTISSILFSL